MTFRNQRAHLKNVIDSETAGWGGRRMRAVCRPHGLSLPSPGPHAIVHHLSAVLLYPTPVQSECLENILPVLRKTECTSYDTTDIRATDPLAQPLRAERRSADSAASRGRGSVGSGRLPPLVVHQGDLRHHHSHDHCHPMTPAAGRARELLA